MELERKMRIGIVGSEAAKFTPETEALARAEIRNKLNVIGAIQVGHPWVVSGGCHLGGIDIWAVEEAKKLGIPDDHIVEYKPKVLRWEGGYKQRNLEIAKGSDFVVCITVKELPPGYKGMRFDRCYHCDTNEHVKSGGCWTVKEAIKMGKEGQVIVI